MSAKPIKAWAVKCPKGCLYYWSYPSRREALREATRYTIGAGEYERLGHWRTRWALAYSRGYRVVRVEVKEIAK